MNDIAAVSKRDLLAPVTPKSNGLRALLDFIADGSSEREQARRLPYDIIDTVRQSRLGALQV